MSFACFVDKINPCSLVWGIVSQLFPRRDHLNILNHPDFAQRSATKSSRITTVIAVPLFMKLLSMQRYFLMDPLLHTLRVSKFVPAHRSCHECFIAKKRASARFAIETFPAVPLTLFQRPGPQLASRHRDFWKYFSTHNGSYILKHLKSIFEYYIFILAKNVDCQHML